MAWAGVDGNEGGLLAGMALATLFVTMPFVARELIPILESMDMSQEEAARTLGANDLEVLLLGHSNVELSLRRHCRVRRWSCWECCCAYLCPSLIRAARLEGFVHCNFHMQADSGNIPVGKCAMPSVL